MVEEEEKEKLQKSYAKLKSTISTITINTPGTTIESLKAQIQNLFQLASSAGINIEIGSLESSLSEKEREVDLKQNKIKYEINALDNQQDNQQLTPQQQARIERDKEVFKACKDLNSFYKPYLATQNKRHKNLDKVIKAMKNGEPIDEKLKKTLHEEFPNKEEEAKWIEEEKRRWQIIQLVAGEKASETLKDHEEDIKKLKVEYSNLTPNEYQKRSAFAKKIQDKENNISEIKTAKEQSAKHIIQRKEYAKNLCRGLDIAKKSGVKDNEDIIQSRVNLFQRIHGIHIEELATREEKQDVNSVNNIMTPSPKQHLGEKLSDSKKAPKDLTEKLIKNFSDGAQENKPSTGTLHPPQTPPVNKAQNKIIRQSIDYDK